MLSGVRSDFPALLREGRNGRALVYLDSAATSHKPRRCFRPRRTSTASATAPWAGARTSSPRRRRSYSRPHGVTSRSWWEPGAARSCGRGTRPPRSTSSPRAWRTRRRASEGTPRGASRWARATRSSSPSPSTTPTSSRGRSSPPDGRDAPLDQRRRRGPPRPRLPRPSWGSARASSPSSTRATSPASSTPSRRSSPAPTRSARSSWTRARPRPTCPSTSGSSASTSPHSPATRCSGPRESAPSTAARNSSTRFPRVFGGSTVKTVTMTETTWLDAPQRFEAGSQPVAQAVGMGGGRGVPHRARHGRGRGPRARSRRAAAPRRRGDRRRPASRPIRLVGRGGAGARRRWSSTGSTPTTSARSSTTPASRCASATTAPSPSTSASASRARRARRFTSTPLSERWTRSSPPSPTFGRSSAIRR